MDTATIRRANRPDEAPLALLWLALMREHAALDARFAVADDALQRWKNDFPHVLADETRRLFVAEQAGELAGFASAQRWAPPPIYAAEGEIYLNELYVAPEARRRGLGRRLVGAVRGWAEDLGAARLRLGVLAANAAGRRFWEHQHARPLSLTYAIELPGRPSPPPERRGRLGF